MARRRRGSAYKRDGKWWARIRYTDSAGVDREKRRRATSKQHAEEIVRKLLADADKTGGRSLDFDAKTFDDLADLYDSQHLVSIQYDADGKKVGGMRGAFNITPDGKTHGQGSLYTAKLQLRTLRETFGGRMLRNITYHDLEEYRAARFAAPTKARRCSGCKGSGTIEMEDCENCEGAGTVRGKRTWATVNRELTMLNRMLTIARQLGWIAENPFRQGESLIKLSQENKRDVTLSYEEEARLLAAFDITTTEGRRVRAMVVCAVDTGMRQGEICQLHWADVDFKRRVIHLRAETTKTLSNREVPISERLLGELTAWREAFQSGKGPLFGYTANAKRTYSVARIAAGASHVRFHDLRHTAATRMIQGGMPIAEVGRILGHSDVSRLLMTYRYINTDDSTMSRAAAIIDAANRTAAGRAQADAQSEPANA